jgi:hypothetical protein
VALLIIGNAHSVRRLLSKLIAQKLDFTAATAPVMQPDNVLRERIFAHVGSIVTDAENTIKIVDVPDPDRLDSRTGTYQFINERIMHEHPLQGEHNTRVIIAKRKYDADQRAALCDVLAHMMGGECKTVEVVPDKGRATE